MWGVVSFHGWPGQVASSSGGGGEWPEQVVALGQWWQQLQARGAVSSRPSFPTCPGPCPVLAGRRLGHNWPLQPTAGWAPGFQQLLEIYWRLLKGCSQEAWAG